MFEQLDLMSAEQRYMVKCDECREVIRWTDSVAESAAGGYCDACRAVLDAQYPERVENRRTYRERREARAERLNEWAAKREAKAEAVFASHERFRGDHAFNFQPGRIPERDRVNAQGVRAFESLQKAREMSSRAAGITAQLERSIYSDDPDAVEQLEARIAELEAKRDAMKVRNAEYRKEHKAELAKLSAYQRGQAVPHPGWEISNLGANITRNRKRLEEIRRGR